MTPEPAAPEVPAAVEPSTTPEEPAAAVPPAHEAPAAAPSPARAWDSEGARGAGTVSIPAWQPSKTADEEAVAAASAAAAATAAAAAAAVPAAPPATPMDDIDRTVFVDSSAVPAAAAAASAEQTINAELVIASGPDSGHSYHVNGPALRIGRAPDNDLILRDPATSGHHARVERRGQEFFIVDLGSTNGTLVNGEVVQERELHNGDSITIGQNAVTFAIR